ncbi:MAG: hypothetical protein RL732_1578, partial [Bacteroidota bacterium]
MFPDAHLSQVNQALESAAQAFRVYRQLSLSKRVAFLRAIAAELENCGDQLIQTTMRETNLPEARLRGERARTIFQLESYALA